MPRLTWSSEALRDVQRLYRFLASNNPNAARRAVMSIRAGVKILGHQPEAGRPVEGLGVQFREWFIEFGDAGYVVFYRLERNTLLILRVRHGREGPR